MNTLQIGFIVIGKIGIGVPALRRDCRAGRWGELDYIATVRLAGRRAGMQQS